MNDNDAKPNGRPNGAPKAIPKDVLRELPKRFYKSVSHAQKDDEGFAVLLDGRNVRTPGKRLLLVPTPQLAEAIAAEWDAQTDRIDPATMPLTRLANSAIDAVSAEWQSVADDIVAFASSDLLCYRAEAPAGLVARQAATWDPVLAWAERDLGAKFVVVAGLMPVTQPAAALDGVRAALAGLDALRLSALHVMTTLTGSALLALAHLRGQLSEDEAWSAATVDETWQRELWGHDEEAEMTAAARRAQFAAASRCLRLLDAR